MIQDKKDSPIKVPYKVTSDIQKYDGPVFNPNPDPFYLSNKREEISKLGNRILCTLPESKNLVFYLSQFCGFKPTEDIAEVALQLEEDIAILHRGKLVSICFCFPSGFDPSEKIGKSFAEMHQPVADGEVLVKMADRISSVISRPGSIYKRYVWTLTTSPKLSRHPSYKLDEPEVSTLDSLYYRRETQITVGHNNPDTSFFFVKIDIFPFLSLPQDLQQSAVKSLKTMSNAVLEYKGLKKIKELF